MSKMFSLRIVAVFLLISSSFDFALAYEVDTHERMSAEAATLSVNLANIDLEALGLTSPDEPLPFADDGPVYEGMMCRWATSSTKTPIEWIKEGAVCEDDTFSQVFARYKNHFYDPANLGKGFGGVLWPNSGIISGMPAPDWAVDKGPADGQLFSFVQGRKYLYEALTATDKVTRKANLARMFRTLGNVTHVVEDMAQPQHTRNDGHGFPKSAYEVYTNDIRNNLSFTGGQIPQFSTAREYFTDLAQFSNSNFVTYGTNFRSVAGQTLPSRRYSLPIPGAATDVPVNALNPPLSAGVLALCASGLPCTMTFYSTNQTVTNERASALSIFDQYLNLTPVTYVDGETSYQTDSVFTLNRYTFDSAHPHLIPRAVSYAAGIIDYFFRGKIDAVQGSSAPSSIVLKNLGSEDLTGQFSLYFDDPNGTRILVFESPSPTSIPANGQSAPMVFTPPPAAKGTDRYLLVFKGDMGQESTTGVAARLILLNTNCFAASSGSLQFTHGGKRTIASISKPNGNPYQGDQLYSGEGTVPFKVAKPVSGGVVSQNPANWLNLSSSSIKFATDNGTLPISYFGNSGIDKSAFTLNADTLTFKVAPDAESPTDKDANNTYETCITAVDRTEAIGTENINADVKYFYNVLKTWPSASVYANIIKTQTFFGSSTLEERYFIPFYTVAEFIASNRLHSLEIMQQQIDECNGYAYLGYYQCYATDPVFVDYSGSNYGGTYLKYNLHSTRWNVIPEISERFIYTGQWSNITAGGGYSEFPVRQTDQHVLTPITNANDCVTYQKTVNGAAVSESYCTISSTPYFPLSD